MYAAVPRMTPALVAAMLTIVGDRDKLLVVDGVSYALANPKSRTLTLPSASMMFPGFRSR